MRVAARTPLRASSFDPATVLSQFSNIPRYSRYFGYSASRSGPIHYARASTLARTSTFCRQCSREQFLSPKNSYSTRTPPAFSPGKPNNNGGKQEPGRSQKKTLKYVAIGGVVVVGAVAFSDKVQHGYRAAERTGRVVGALAVCINE